MGGRLYALAHGVRQKVAHLGVAAGATVWGVDVVEGTLAPTKPRMKFDVDLGAGLFHLM